MQKQCAISSKYCIIKLSISVSIIDTFDLDDINLVQDFSNEPLVVVKSVLSVCDAKQICTKFQGNSRDKIIFTNGRNMFTFDFH